VNGITKQVEITKADFESIITKKSNIVFKAHKLHLKKKTEISNNNPSTAYSIYLVITPCKFFNLNLYIIRLSICPERVEQNSIESGITWIDESECGE
jgi:hypothetical protein